MTSPLIQGCTSESIIFVLDAATTFDVTSTVIVTHRRGYRRVPGSTPSPFSPFRAYYHPRDRQPPEISFLMYVHISAGIEPCQELPSGDRLLRCILARSASTAVEQPALRTPRRERSRRNGRYGVAPAADSFPLGGNLLRSEGGSRYLRRLRRASTAFDDPRHELAHLGRVEGPAPRGALGPHPLWSGSWPRAGRSGLTADDAEEVREAILSAALSGEADPAHEEEFGKRYMLDFEMKIRRGHGNGPQRMDRPSGRRRPEVHELLRALGVR